MKTFIHKNKFTHKKHPSKEDASLDYLALLNKNRQNFRCFHAGGKKRDGNLISEKKKKSQFFSFESDELWVRTKSREKMWINCNVSGDMCVGKGSHQWEVRTHNSDAIFGYVRSDVVYLFLRLQWQSWILDQYACNKLAVGQRQRNHNFYFKFRESWHPS